MTNDLMPVNQDLHNRIVSSYILPTYYINSETVRVILSLYYRKYKCFMHKQILFVQYQQFVRKEKKKKRFSPKE